MIKVTSTFDAKAWEAKVKKQTAYATAVAINAAAKAVQQESSQALERELDRPTPFTKDPKRAMFLSYARAPAKMFADVGFRDIQSAYLMYQFAGGTRRPKNKALRIPAQIRLNQYGNLPKDTIKKLVAQSKRKKGLIFYGQPSPGLPPGLWRRVGKTLEPVIMFPARAAKYRKRFDWFKWATTLAKRELPKQIDIALRYALSTAR